MYVCMFLYLLQNVVMCSLLALSFLAGGVANAIYADDNADLALKNREGCKLLNYFDTENHYPKAKKFCKDIKRVRDFQTAAAVSYEEHVHDIEYIASI